MMDLCHRVEQILTALRPGFRRQATFQWFVLLLWGVLLADQAPAVTSYLNALGLSESHDHRALHWFHSSAWQVSDLWQRWGEWLAAHRSTQRLQGQWVYVADGLKVAKAGRKMPGVKRLHPASQDVSKPEGMRGHDWGALALLLGAGAALFAVPVAVQLQDGIAGVTVLTWVDKMAELCVQLMAKGSYAVLDADFAAANVLQVFRQSEIHLISRVRSTTVGYAPFSPLPGRRRGRPRKWGSPVKLKLLFQPVAAFPRQPLSLYGQSVMVHDYSIQLYWDSPEHWVQFVLTQLPGGQQMILITSDLTLTPQAVIEAYGWRFKIEVSFRTLIHLLGGFGDRFWLKSMPTAPRWPPNLNLANAPAAFRQQVARKVEAFERFVTLHALALGIWQILAVAQADPIWAQFPRWFRTLPQHGYPTEQVVRLTLQHRAPMIFATSKPGLLLPKFLAALAAKAKPPQADRLAS